MLYKYDNEYQVLQQYDEDGTLRSSMSMSKGDLYKIVQLYLQENILDNEEDFGV